MCKVLKISRSGYYSSRKRPVSNRALKNNQIALAAKCFHEQSHKIYGYRKVYEDIKDNRPDLNCAIETLRKIMVENHLYSCTKKKFITTTDSNHKRPVAENILDRDFTANAPNQKWVADITYIRTYEGWLYLAVVMDLFSRCIVGWATSDKIDSALVCEAFSNAINLRHPQGDLLHHSDRGVQYASSSFQRILDISGVECSMSRLGNCWDNACSESFFGKFKCEAVRGKIYKSKQAAREDVFWYIEIFYNRQRRHASLGYVSPVEFEKAMTKAEIKAA